MLCTSHIFSKHSNIRIEKLVCNMTSWDIVFFLKDNTSEYVPTSWATNVNKNMYLWPKKLSEIQIKKLRDSCSKPSVNIDYNEWDGICKATVYTLEDAQKLAKKAEYTSHLSSDPVENELDSDMVDDEEDKSSEEDLNLLRHKLKKKAGNNTISDDSSISKRLCIDSLLRTPTGVKGKYINKLF